MLHEASDWMVIVLRKNCSYALEFVIEGKSVYFYSPFVRPDIDTWFVWLSPPTVLELQL